MKRLVMHWITLLAACTGLGSCMTDDLQLQTESPFSIATSTTPPQVQASDTVIFRLTITPSPSISSAVYAVSYQNQDTTLRMRVQLAGQLLRQGEWARLPDLSPWITVRCNQVGQPKLLFYVRDQAGMLQSTSVSYLTTP